MKAVLMSIRPKWCGKILNGEKTIEVRKTHPRVETPFKAYVYMTKGLAFYREKNEVNTMMGGQCVIAEFTCSDVEKALYNENGYGLKDEKSILQKSCLSEKELYHYLQGGPCYLWHISNLKIYNHPKQIGDFYVESNATTDCPQLQALKQPPQSWCYVEVE